MRSHLVFMSVVRLFYPQDPAMYVHNPSLPRMLLSLSRGNNVDHVVYYIY